MEMRWEEQDNMGFINHKKAYSTVPREMAMTALMWMCVPQSEVTMVEGTYKETHGISLEKMCVLLVW